MTAPDELTFDRASARITRFMAIVTAIGVCVALVLGGLKGAAGFLVGAAISGLNYRWLHGLVAGLGGEVKARYRTVFLGFRYFLLGLGAYVIVRLSPISLKAMLAGLFVLTGAVFIEVAFEIIYGRKGITDHQDL